MWSITARCILIIAARLWASCCTFCSFSIAWLLTCKLVVRVARQVPTAIVADPVAVKYGGLALLTPGQGRAMVFGKLIFIALALWSIGQVLAGRQRAARTALMRALGLGAVIVLGVAMSSWIQLWTGTRRPTPDPKPVAATMPLTESANPSR